MSDRARVSVVIPAHDEGAVIGRCLDSLAAQPLAPFCEVVVVANGCKDDTASVARSYADRLPLIDVLELPASGKVGALNAGDQAATAFPRIFLDADIEISPDALDHLVGSLEGVQPRVAAPQIVFDTTDADFFVRAFYRAMRALPYVNDGLVGLGLYGLSRSGRARFGEFPDVTADDLFVQRCFADDERITTSGTFTVRVPRDIRSLMRVRQRVNQGNAEMAVELAGDEAVASERTTGGTMSALARLALRHPSMIFPAFVYVAVSLLSRVNARKPGREWLRDESSRR